jgi:uncharacterized protein
MRSAFFVYRVIFQLNEADDYRINLVLNNINNVLADLDEVEIELVAYSQGVILYIPDENPYQARIQDLQSRGVIFAVCNNTLRSMNLTPDDLWKGVIVVPSGVGELVKKQSEGWIYIRP